MRTQHRQPMIYKHKELMDQFNDLQIRIKTHLFDIGSAEFKRMYPKPTNKELDEMMHKILSVLRDDSRPMRSF